MNRTFARAWMPVALAAIAPALSACAQQPSVVIDGDLGDWVGTTAARASEDHLFVRFSPSEPFTLQGGQRCTRILLDVDAETGTGMTFVPPGGGTTLGVDLEIQVSPLPDNEGDDLSTGARVIAHRPAGVRTFLDHEDVGFEVAPTYAADSYELRIDRTLAKDVRGGLVGVPTLARSQRVRGVVVQTDRDGAALWSSEPFDLELNHALDADTPPAGVIPPAGGALRVVSHNVLHTSPARTPHAFARLYRAIRPDVMLVQEWDAWTGERLAEWFDRHVPTDSGWHAVAHPSERAGVAVISRYPIRAAIDEQIYAQGSSWPVRFVGAVIDAPGGPVLAGSVHLKCCGYAGSSEDVRRVHEANAINALVRRTLDEHGIDRCVIAGDLNLVGSRPPLDALRAALDADGSDLEPANPRVLGDATAHTWTDDESNFSPGRLDWLVYADSVWDSPFASVVETGRFARTALRAMDLREDDSRASDHLPLVVDLAPVD